VSFANALRRTLLSGVPTVAISDVFINTNDSVTHDEVLSHRLGMIPLDVNADEFEAREEGEEPSDYNTIVFILDVVGVRGGKNDVTSVMSKDLVFQPNGDQAERLSKPPKPYHDDILITKLKPGQRVNIECHAILGTGKKHARFSPVTGCSYRMYPQVELLGRVFDHDADELVVYEPGVFDMKKVTDVPGKTREAVVSRPLNSTMSRNYNLNPTLSKLVQISRIENKFIFEFETEGIDPVKCLNDAIDVLIGKAEKLREGLSASERSE